MHSIMFIPTNSIPFFLDCLNKSNEWKSGFKVVESYKWGTEALDFFLAGFDILIFFLTSEIIQDTFSYGHFS